MHNLIDVSTIQTQIDACMHACIDKHMNASFFSVESAFTLSIDTTATKNKTNKPLRQTIVAMLEKSATPTQTPTPEHHQTKIPMHSTTKF